MAIVYVHRRCDTNDIFYVGIGKDKTRCYQKKYRNSHWRNIVEKHGYSCEVIFEGITWEEACSIEKTLIAKYKRKKDGGILCNITAGGEGVVGVSWSQEHRKKISDGNKGKKRSESTKRKISQSRKGIVFSEEHKKNISKSKSGSKLSEETKKKMSISKSGGMHNMARTIIDLETGIFYGCIKEACFATNTPLSTARWRLKNRYNVRFDYA